MQKFFISSNEFNSKTFDSDHSLQLIKVLRVRPGFKCLVGYDSKTYNAIVTSISKNTVSFDLLDLVDLNTEFLFNVSLYQCLGKNKKFEDIIKHATELGCKSFTPVLSRRVEVKYPNLNYDRLTRIALEAAEQSFREIIPCVCELIDLKDIDVSTFSHFIVFYEDLRNSKSNLKDIFKTIDYNSNVCFLIGPEGGFSKEEIELLKDKGAIICGLGRRILRTECAPLAALAMLSYEKELSND